MRVGATLEEIHDMKMESWSMRVLSVCCDYFGPNIVQTWDLEAGYACNNARRCNICTSHRAGGTF